MPVTAYYPGSYMAMAALATSALSPQTVKKATRADLVHSICYHCHKILGDHSITTGIYLCPPSAEGIRWAAL